MPRAETRYFNLTGIAVASLPATWTSLFVLPRIAAGTTATTRTGEWITVKYLRIRMNLVFKGNNQIARVAGFIVRDGNVSFPPSIAIDDAMKSDVSWDRKDWVRILFDRKITPRAGAILPDTASTTEGQVVRKTISLRMKQPIHFTGSASTDEGRNFIQIFMIGQGTSVADSFEYDMDGYCTWVNQV